MLSYIVIPTICMQNAKIFYIQNVNAEMDFRTVHSFSKHPLCLLAERPKSLFSLMPHGHLLSITGGQLIFIMDIWTSLLLFLATKLLLSNLPHLLWNVSSSMPLTAPVHPHLAAWIDVLVSSWDEMHPKLFVRIISIPINHPALIAV